MWRRPRILVGITVVTAAILVVPAAALRRPPRNLPSLRIGVLGFTNRIGPVALLGITNTSEAPIILSGQCLVKYSPTQGPRQPVSFEANTTAVVRLLPNQGFIQEVFVFPSGESVWQFEITAAYASSSMELRRSTENLLRRCFPWVRYPLTGRAYRRFGTDWLPAPP